MIIIEEKKRIPSKKALDEVEACDVHIFEPKQQGLRLKKYKDRYS